MSAASFLSELKRTSIQKLDIQRGGGGQFMSMRRGMPRESRTTSKLLLVPDENGVLDWEEGGAIVPGLTKKRRGGGVADDGSHLVSFPKLEPSLITDMLLRQDAKFTPLRGVRQYNSGSASIEAPLPAEGRILLFIHGTFSNGDNFVSGLEETTFGSEFLQEASRKYDGVFAFHHPTISVGPLVNAIDLQRILLSTKAQIDIISHSRGGLVTRWWCEMFDPNLDRCRNAILVGSPLAGTGLAAPPNIRKALKLLTNYGNALNQVVGMAAAAAPVLGLVNTLLTVITSVTSIAASTPIADCLMGMIPGLYAQSRVGNNPELLRLHESKGGRERYAAVKANYESEDPGWRFWKYFSKDVLVDSATDLIFSGANDLVVDTSSMSYLSEELQVPAKRVLDFGTTNEVHHVNYFAQNKTIDFCRGILNV